MMAADPRSLDIPESQICVDFFDDPGGFNWHHRILMVKGLAPGEWIVATPDLEIQFENVALHRVVAVPRHAPFPPRVRGELYAFDPELLAATMDTLRLEARSLASILGIKLDDPAAGAAAPRWVISDPASELFSKELDPQIPQDDTRFVARDAVGVAHVSEAEGWVAVENVSEGDAVRWAEEKRTGPGRDPRLLPIARDSIGGGSMHRVRLEEVHHLLKQEAFPDWPFRGPTKRAVVELVEAVVASGHTFASYWGYWVNQSGVVRQSAVANEMKVIMDTISYALTYDLVNIANLSSFEMLARRAIQIQKAVRKCPKHPSFEGLEMMLSSTLDESGGAVVSQFEAFYSDEQRKVAHILKQQRLWQEEREQDAKRMDTRQRGKGGGGSNDGGGHDGGAGDGSQPKKKGGGRGRGGGET